LSCSAAVPGGESKKTTGGGDAAATVGWRPDGAHVKRNAWA